MFTDSNSRSRSASPSEPITPPSSQRTNTLAVTSLPKDFFQPIILDALRHHFATYGEINQWVPLKTFGRVIIVYNDEDAAEKAKLECDPVVIEGSKDRSDITLRVYRADPNPLLVETVNNSYYLAPPPIEKNFLISPPGSPPIGWEPIKEDPPNVTPLADDIIAALRKLQLRTTKRSSLEVLIHPEEGSGGVGVSVQDCDYDEGAEDEEGGMIITEDEWVYGESAPARTKWRPIATALPPIHQVMDN